MAARHAHERDQRERKRGGNRPGNRISHVLFLFSAILANFWIASLESFNKQLITLVLSARFSVVCCRDKANTCAVTRRRFPVRRLRPVVASVVWARKLRHGAGFRCRSQACQYRPKFCTQPFQRGFP